MAIHLYKTSTPCIRNGAVDSQVKSNPRNNLIYGQHCCGKGRNARGIITANHRGVGHKRLYRKIDFRRNEKNIYGRIITIEYDLNRNAYICLIHYGDGEKRYILHPRGAIIGDTIVFGKRPVVVPNFFWKWFPWNWGPIEKPPLQDLRKGSPALGVNQVRLRRLSLAAVIGEKTMVPNDCDGEQVSGPDSSDSSPINDEVNRDRENEDEKGSVEGLDDRKMIRVCDKLIEVFLVDKPTPTDWRRLLAFSKEWSSIRPLFFQRCQDRADGLLYEILNLESSLAAHDLFWIMDSAFVFELLYFEKISVRHPPYLGFSESPRNAKFLISLDGSVTSYGALAKLGSTCMASVQAYDTAAESFEAINAAELKFQDIIRSPSLDVACQKIDCLAEKSQLDSALVLMITKAWSSAKESNMTKDELKDILYHLYMTARGNLQRLLPKEIRIVKYLFTIEDPEVRLCALNHAFKPGEELEGKYVDNLYTTHEKLHTWMRAVVDAYNFIQEGTLLREARDLMNPKMIEKLEELIKIVEKNFM
ncbi:hypothetical protein REPUB_Repub19eG0089600 [Reevesia pubescens]